MKKFLSLLLTLCLLLGILPSQALAYVGDILPSTGSTVTTETRADGTLVLQNDYIRVTLNKHDGSLTTSPAATADSANSIDRQKPYCEFIIYGSYGYGKAHPATLRLKSAEFVDTTPNGTAKAIKAVYDLTVNLSGKSVAATTAVYYELVQLKENETSADTWGVLTSIDNIKINNNRDDLFGSLTGDMGVIWGYTLDAFSGMGHANATDGPAIKMSRTVYNYDEQVEISTVLWYTLSVVRATNANLMRKIIYIIYRLWSENDPLSRISGNRFSIFLYCNRNKEEVSKCKLKSS